MSNTIDPNRQGFSNKYLDEAFNRATQWSGMNLWNTAMRRGTSNLAGQRTASMQEAIDLLGRDPNVLRRVIGDVTTGFAKGASDLNVGTMRESASMGQQAAGTLGSLGTAIEQMKQEERKMQLQEKLAKQEMIGNLIGNVVGIAGTAVTGGMGNAQLLKLLKALKDKDDKDDKGDEDQEPWWAKVMGQ